MKTKNRFTIGKIVVVTFVLGWLIFWVWALAFADPRNPDTLDSVDFATDSEQICAAAIAQIDAMPSARDAANPMERSEQVRESTIVVIEMVAALHEGADQTVSERDLELLDGWLADYDAYVADRLRYIDTLASADESTSPKELAFTLTPRATGSVYTRRIDAFARANDMPSCQVPGDV